VLLRWLPHVLNSRTMSQNKATGPQAAQTADRLAAALDHLERLEGATLDLLAEVQTARQLLEAPMAGRSQKRKRPRRK
jgi:hypothetical protein